MKSRERILAIVYMVLGAVLCVLSGLDVLHAPLVPILGIALLISGFSMLLRTNVWRRKNLEHGASSTEPKEEKKP